MDKEAGARKAIVEADATVVAVMIGYLRTCRSGGMPRELCDRIEASVRDAAELKSFSVALAADALKKSAT